MDWLDESSIALKWKWNTISEQVQGLFYYFFSMRFKGLLHPKMKIVIIHLPACRSNSIKALFVFGTQLNIF